MKQQGRRVYRSDKAGFGRQASRQVEFAPRTLRTLLRRSNHLSYLGGPKSLPHSLDLYYLILLVFVLIQTVCYK